VVRLGVGIGVRECHAASRGARLAWGSSASASSMASAAGRGTRRA